MPEPLTCRCPVRIKTLTFGARAREIAEQYAVPEPRLTVLAHVSPCQRADEVIRLGYQEAITDYVS